MNDKQLYIEFTKRDLDKRIVEGWASTEALDSQGEVVKLSAIEKALPSYMTYGNLREMHQFSAVGKAIHAQVDKVKKGLRLVGKIVDKDAWEKVKEGVYNGFSIGGKVLKRIDNTIEELSLNEISLVDRPANPEAVFTMVKINHPEATNKPMEMKHTELMVAGHILDLARELRMTLDMFQYEGRSTKELSTALSVLKNLAVKILNQEDKKKFDKVLYDINFQELEKYTSKPKEVKEEERTNLKKFINNSWTVGYFENVKKALG